MHGFGRHLALLLAITSLSGCATVHLHSDADQKAMDGAIAGFTSAKQSQLQSLAEHRVVLQDLIAKQRTAVTVEKLRLRDELLIVAIDGNDQGALDAARRQELSALVGAESFPPPKHDKTFWNLVTTRDTRMRHLASFARRVRSAEAALVSHGGKIVTPCGDRGQTGSYDTTDGDTGAPQAAKDATDLCSDLAAEWTTAEARWSVDSQPPLIACVLGAAEKCIANRQWVAFDAFADLLEVEALIEANRKIAAAAKKHLEGLEKTYACAQRADLAGGPGTRVAAAAELVEDFLAVLPSSGEDVQKTGAPTAVPAKSDACPDEPAEILSFADLLGKAGLVPDDLKQLLDRLGNIDAADTVVATLADAKATFQQTKLAALLKDVANASRPGADQPDVAKMGVAAGFVALLDPLHRLVAANSGDLPDTRAILVDLAMARYERARAQVELDRLARSREAIQLRADSYLQALAYLDRASRATRREERIIALANVWNRGEIPAAAAEVELRGYRYAAWIANEEAAVKASYDTIEPLLAELQTYATGGFTAEEIARFLNAASLAAIAFGVN